MAGSDRASVALAGAASRRETMTMGLYCTLDGTDSRFDGHRAQTHLTHGLAMHQASDIERSGIFRGWLERCSSAIQVHPAGPSLLRAPAWFR